MRISESAAPQGGGSRGQSWCSDPGLKLSASVLCSYFYVGG